MEGVEVFGVVDDVLAVVAVLRHIAVGGGAFLPFADLQIPQREGEAELLNLVAGVVDVEFPTDVIARPVEDRGEGVADCAAAGVADVHRAGGVGGDEFYQHLFPFAETGAAVILPFPQDREDAVREPLPAEEEVDKAGAGHFDLFKAGAV